MANRKVNGLWALVALVAAMACQRLHDQPTPDPLAAPNLGDLTVGVSDSGIGYVPLPGSADLAGGAVSMRFSRPRWGSITVDSARRVRYLAGPFFAGRDTAEYEMRRGNSTSRGRVIVQMKPSHCLPVAYNDSVTLVAGQPTYTIAPTRRDHLCGNVRLEADAPSAAGAAIQVYQQTLLYSPRPGFLGADSLGYRLVNTSGVVRHAKVYVQVEAAPPCTTRLQAVNDTVQFRFGGLNFSPSYTPAQFLANDIACPDSLDPASFWVFPPNQQGVLLDIRLDRGPNQQTIVRELRFRIYNQSLRSVAFRYLIKSRSRRHVSYGYIVVKNLP